MSVLCKVCAFLVLKRFVRKRYRERFCIVCLQKSMLSRSISFLSIFLSISIKSCSCYHIDLIFGRKSNAGSVQLCSLASNNNPDSAVQGLKKILFPQEWSRREQVSNYKSKLWEIVNQKQSALNRLQVERILEEMITLNPCRNVQDEALLGTWRLLWSSQTADVNPFQKPSQVYTYFSFKLVMC